MMRNATIVTPSNTGTAISTRPTTNRFMAFPSLSGSGQSRSVEKRVPGHTEVKPLQVAHGGVDPTDVPEGEEDRILHEGVGDVLEVRGTGRDVSHGVRLRDRSVDSRITVVSPVETGLDLVGRDEILQQERVDVVVEDGRQVLDALIVRRRSGQEGLRGRLRRDSDRLQLADHELRRQIESVR